MKMNLDPDMSVLISSVEKYKEGVKAGKKIKVFLGENIDFPTGGGDAYKVVDVLPSVAEAEKGMFYIVGDTLNYILDGEWKTISGGDLPSGETEYFGTITYYSKWEGAYTSEWSDNCTVKSIDFDKFQAFLDEYGSMGGSTNFDYYDGRWSFWGGMGRVEISQDEMLEKTGIDVELTGGDDWAMFDVRYTLDIDLNSEVLTATIENESGFYALANARGETNVTGKLNTSGLTIPFAAIKTYDNVPADWQRQWLCIPNSFLSQCKNLETAHLYGQVLTIGNSVLSSNPKLTEVHLPTVQVMAGQSLCAYNPLLTNSPFNAYHKDVILGDSYLANTGIVSASFPSLRHIPSSFCANCHNLTNVSLSGSTIETISNNVFGGCEKITGNIDMNRNGFPNLVSVKDIFSSTGISSFGIDAPKLESFGGVSYCPNLTSINISSQNFKTFETFGQGNKNLESVSLNIPEEGVTVPYHFLQDSNGNVRVGGPVIKIGIHQNANVTKTCKVFRQTNCTVEILNSGYEEIVGCGSKVANTYYCQTDTFFDFETFEQYGVRVTVIDEEAPFSFVALADETIDSQPGDEITMYCSLDDWDIIGNATPGAWWAMWNRPNPGQIFSVEVCSRSISEWDKVLPESFLANWRHRLDSLDIGKYEFATKAKNYAYGSSPYLRCYTNYLTEVGDLFGYCSGITYTNAYLEKVGDKFLSFATQPISTPSEVRIARDSFIFGSELQAVNTMFEIERVGMNFLGFVCWTPSTATKTFKFPNLTTAGNLFDNFCPKEGFNLVLPNLTKVGYALAEKSTCREITFGDNISWVVGGIAKNANGLTKVKMGKCMYEPYGGPDALATLDPESPMYKNGVVLVGEGVEEFMKANPNSDTSPYRKLINGNSTSVIPKFTMTSTDPGEGQPLAENEYIAVYEEN